MRLADSVVLKRFDESVVVLDTRSGEYFTAEGTGALIIDHIADGVSDESAICAALRSAFDVGDEDTVAEDVRAFLAELQAAELLVAP